jgi:hypothetical protein
MGSVPAKWKLADIGRGISSASLKIADESGPLMKSSI